MIVGAWVLALVKTPRYLFSVWTRTEMLAARERVGGGGSGGGEGTENHSRLKMTDYAETAPRRRKVNKKLADFLHFCI